MQPQQPTDPQNNNPVPPQLAQPSQPAPQYQAPQPQPISQPAPAPQSQAFQQQFQSQPQMGQPVGAPQFAAPVGAPGPAPQYHLDARYGHDGMAIASLIMGIVSIPASILTIYALPIPIIAIVLGIISLKRSKKLAISGIVLAGVGLLLTGLLLIFAASILSQAKQIKANADAKTSTSVSVANVTNDCFTVSLPSTVSGNVSGSQVNTPGNCQYVIIGPGSTEDFGVSTTAIAATSNTAPQNVANLKTVADTLKSQIEQSGGVVNEPKAVTVGTQSTPGYEISGTQATGSYKYFEGIVFIAPKSYTDDATHRYLITMYADSATSATPLTDVANSFEFK